MIRSLMVAVTLSLSPLAVAQDIPEASAAFADRQADLVELSRSLGNLHRLHQVCGDAYNPDLFRNRMKEFVPLEAPMARTREDMIAAFNEGYRNASDLYFTCNRDTREAYKAAAADAQIVTERLAAPFE